MNVFVRSVWIIISALPLILPCNAQTAKSVRGVVIDSITQQPLAGATVRITGTSTGRTTDKSGHFQLLLSGESAELLVKFIGYNDAIVFVKNGEHRTIALAPDVVKTGGVTVTGGSGVTVATRETSEVTPAELDKHRGQTFAKALENIAGVTTLQTGASVAKPVIRGLHSQRIVVINGGLPQEGQQWGAEHAPEIDPFAPNSISVIKGAAGVEYGVGAIGGVIRVEPRPFPDHIGFGGSATLNGFSNNRQISGSVMLEGRPGLLPDLAMRLRVSGRKAGDYSSADFVAGNTGFQELDISAAAEYAASDHLKFDALYSRFSTTLGVYKGSHIGNLDDLHRAITLGRPPVDFTFTYDITGPKQEISHDLWSIGTVWNVPEWGKIEARYGFQVNNREEFDSRRRFFDSTTSEPISAFALRLQTYTGELKFRHKPSDGFSGAIGISGLFQSNAGRSRTFLIPDFSQNSLGIFAYEEYVTASTAYSIGLRADMRALDITAYPPKNIADATMKYAGISAQAGVLTNLDEHWSLSLNVSSGWRTPSVNELYSDGVHHGAAQYEIGLRSLQPERSVSAEAGIGLHSGSFEAEGSIFLNHINNYIYLLPDTTPVLTLRGLFPVMRYTQTEALLYGAELTMHYGVTEFLRLDAMASAVIGDDITKSQPLFQMPSNRLRLGAHFHVASVSEIISEGYADITGTFVGRQSRFVAGQDYLEPPAGYTLIGVAVGGEIPAGSTVVRLSFEVENLLNARYRDYLSRYRYFLDDQGRNFIIRCSVPFGISAEH